MPTSIIEHSDGTTFVVVTEQDGEHHAYDIMQTDDREEFGQIEHETFHYRVIFHYSLLGAPNAHAEEVPDLYGHEDEHA